MMSELQSHIIVGSGPAGVAAAYALVNQGLDVTMLDVGVDLEADTQATIERLRTTGPEAWPPDSIAKLKSGMLATASGIPKKLTYGSDYPFRNVGQAAEVETGGVEILLSGALGGLSNAWGSNVMPYARHDISDWCITFDELAPHYSAVASFLPVSATGDDLEEFFPIHHANGAMLDSSSQAQTLLRSMRPHRDELRKDGVLFGHSRLAVQAKPTPANDRGCVYCGLCLYGCPYRLIYSSREGVRQLMGHRSFRYVHGVIVESVREVGEAVQISARRTDGQPVQFTANRAYLACGAIATTRIVLASLEAFDVPVLLKDSQYFLFPALQFDRSSAVMSERLHTLGQVYVEVIDPAISQRTIQLQFYTYNDLFLEALRGKLGFLHPVIRPFLPMILGRLVAVMGYLHSDDSASLSIRLCKQDGRSKLVIEPIHSARTRPIIDATLRKLWKHRAKLRAVPLTPMLEVFKPGKSYHYGGTLPMSRSPAGLQSDTLGRPAGFRRVHAVDASVLPSIAATSIVFTAMANAHRIASAAGRM
jgi:choline dehydrogenase-like flavoprotein